MARGRPRKALLSRDLIVNTALRLIDAGEELNLSRIARELSVHVSSLYNHVTDRDGLVEELRVQIAHEYPVPPLEGLTWQETISAVASTIHSAFSAHPRLIPYLATLPVSSPEITVVYAQMAESMLAAGHARESIVTAIQSIDALALGLALVDSSESPPLVLELNGGGPLTVHTHRSSPDSTTNPTFTFGVTALIRGLETELASRTSERV